MSKNKNTQKKQGIEELYYEGREEYFDRACPERSERDNRIYRI